MEEDTLLSETAELIAQDFELNTAQQTWTEEELLQLLSEQVAYLIDHRLEYLMSLMYRLDIDERKVNYALSPLSAEPPPVGMARLILDRQKQRTFTKHYYKTDTLDDMEGLEI
ncbi:MAG TPA: hypothetical protein PKA00_21855 [Saprospiraceae bacterium]|nr:hypothetical protein [Saprospiraceae bacterium]HMQ85572.1 hypothetical protein [Saprospiraceae bacterium]